jgi:hypothetical protein
MITAKQYDILMTKLIVIENKQEVIMNTQSEILSTLKSLTNKTVVITDVNERMDKLEKDVKSLQDEGEM